MRIIISFLSAFSIYSFMKSLPDLSAQRSIRARLDRYFEVSRIKRHSDESSSFYKLLSISYHLRRYSFINKIFESIKSYYPLEEINKILKIAGLSLKINIEDFIYMQITLCMLLIIPFLPLMFNQFSSGILFVSIIIAIGFYYPYFYLKNRIEKKQNKIKKELPGLIDLLYLGVDAGMSLNRVIELYCSRFSNVLSSELEKTKKEIKLGISRKYALKSLIDRNQLEDLTLFISSIIQAEKLGTPLSKILRSQSKEIKTRQRQWIKEICAKAPIKMLFPLAFLIMPSLFAVLLGPLMIRMFSGGGF